MRLRAAYEEGGCASDGACGKWEMDVLVDGTCTPLPDAVVSYEHRRAGGRSRVGS